MDLLFHLTSVDAFGPFGHWQQFRNSFTDYSMVTIAAGRPFERQLFAPTWPDHHIAMQCGFLPSYHSMCVIPQLKK